MDLSWFWDEWFWFPHDRPWGWKDLENHEGSSEYRPQIKDLHWAVPFGLCLLALRFFLEHVLVVPVALKLGVPSKKTPLPKPNTALEAAFKQNQSPDHKTVLALSKQTDLSERSVQIWFRRRKQKDVPTALQKFRESSWQLLFYSTFFIYGVVVLWNKPYTWTTRLCWENWPHQHVPREIYWYYVTELAFYWSLIFTLFWDHKRKDFTEMMVHHVATIVLMYFSWILNFVRVGSLVLLVHDAADSWLSLAKMSVYLKKETATDVFFGIFLLVWVISRLIIYPYVVLYCTTVEPYYIIDTTFGGHIFFNIFLYILQILHILWSYMIFRIVINKIIQGRIRDVRSDSEESEEESGDSVEINGRVVGHEQNKSSSKPNSYSLSQGSLGSENQTFDAKDMSNGITEMDGHIKT